MAETVKAGVDRPVVLSEQAAVKAVRPRPPTTRRASGGNGISSATGSVDKKELKVDLMMDSGAFTAWTRQEVLDIDKYIDFIKACEGYLYSYVSLDCIPGKVGIKREPKDFAAAVKVSYENHQRLKKAGLRPIPVFHQGENLEWLNRMVEDGEEYIGISPADDAKPSTQTVFMDKCFTRLCDSQGRPYVKTHGFGVLNLQHLIRYPWYTADGTSWVMIPGYGRLYIPSYTNDVPDYTRPTLFTFSGEHSAKDRDRRQYESAPPASRKAIERFLAEVGVTPAEARYETEAGRRVMLHYYRKFCEQRGPDVRFKHPTTDFWEGGEKPKFSNEPYTNMTFRPIMATLADRPRSLILTEMGYRDRLLSYYKYNDPEAIKKYVLTGGCDPTYTGPRRPKTKWNSKEYASFRNLSLARHVERYRQGEYLDEEARPTAEVGSRLPSFSEE